MGIRKNTLLLLAIYLFVSKWYKLYWNIKATYLEHKTSLSSLHKGQVPRKWQSGILPEESFPKYAERMMMKPNFSVYSLTNSKRSRFIC